MTPWDAKIPKLPQTLCWVWFCESKPAATVRLRLQPGRARVPVRVCAACARRLCKGSDSLS